MYIFQGFNIFFGMCIFHTASWSSALTHHNISQSWFILPKLVQNVLKFGSFSKSWFKMCPKLVHFLKVGSFSKSWYEMCQNQVNNYISIIFNDTRMVSVACLLGLVIATILKALLNCSWLVYLVYQRYLDIQSFLFFSHQTQGDC